MQAFLDQFKNLYTQQYLGMGAGSWFMLVGIIICAIVIWTRVLHAVHLGN